jgi:lysylphosphatidylglycerol synthetase-like protein (DUF2156 family)
MVLDWLLYACVTFALAWMLNRLFFRKNGASEWVFWPLIVVVFLVNLAGMTTLKLLRYKQISAEVSLQVEPQNPLDLSGALAMTAVFYASINRRKKVVADEGEHKSEVHNAPKSDANFRDKWNE